MGNRGTGSKYGKGSVIPSQSRTMTTLVRNFSVADHFLPSLILLQPHFLFSLRCFLSASRLIFFAPLPLSENSSFDCSLTQTMSVILKHVSIFLNILS